MSIDGMANGGALSGAASVSASRKERKRPIGHPSKVGDGGVAVNTREYAIAWGVKNRPYSGAELRRMCADPNAPSWTFLTRKCWKGFVRYYNALVNAGMPPRPPRTDAERREVIGKAVNDGFLHGLLPEDYDIARIAAGYGIRTQADYNRVRKSDDDARRLLPCFPSLKKKFGNWKRFVYEVCKYDADMTMTEYVRKSAEAGHWLRIPECDSLGIPIRKVMDILRPRIFNTLCYRKLESMGLASGMGEYSGKSKTSRSRQDEK